MRPLQACSTGHVTPAGATALGPLEQRSVCEIATVVGPKLQFAHGGTEVPPYGTTVRIPVPFRAITLFAVVNDSRTMFVSGSRE